MTKNILTGNEAISRGLRWCHTVATKGKVIINNEAVFPNRVLIEKEDYPKDIKDKIEKEALKLFM
ncbi:hypothetical protein [Clostridium algidicarnis]|uniref:hypothetical protein n=1 Tax=Clostridium algidicarnis TaxID=37659 RepID=UPI00049815DA|nr:hypothetical protein [Clostridium algidicarnis]